MTILVVESQEEAQMFRGTQVSQRKGALVVNKDLWGDVPHLLEKIIDLDEWDPSKPVDKVNWKKDTLILVVKGSEEKLDEIEAECPGFKDHFGPMKEMPRI